MESVLDYAGFAGWVALGVLGFAVWLAVVVVAIGSFLSNSSVDTDDRGEWN